MQKKIHILELLLNLITKSCGIIACYGAVIALTIFYPIRSAQVHNVHAHLVAAIFYPAAAILTVICSIQIITIYFQAFSLKDNFEGKFDKGFFIIISMLIMFFLTLLVMIMPILSLYQEFK